MGKLDPNLDIYDLNKIPIWEYGLEAGRTRPLNQELAFKNLVDFKNTCDKLGVKFCLSHGTMLGVWRDSKFIPWDDDVDVAIFDVSKLDKLAVRLRKLGFFVPPKCTNPQDIANPKKECPYYDFVAIRNGEKIEAWYFEKIGNYYVYDHYRVGSDLKHPSYFYEPLQDYEWRGRTWKVPNNLNEYLIFMYGRKWNIPNKDRKYNKQKYDVNGNYKEQNH